SRNVDQIKVGAGPPAHSAGAMAESSLPPADHDGGTESIRPEPEILKLNPPLIVETGPEAQLPAGPTRESLRNESLEGCTPLTDVRDRRTDRSETPDHSGWKRIVTIAVFFSVPGIWAYDRQKRKAN